MRGAGFNIIHNLCKYRALRWSIRHTLRLIERLPTTIRSRLSRIVKNNITIFGCAKQVGNVNRANAASADSILFFRNMRIFIRFVAKHRIIVFKTNGRGWRSVPLRPCGSAPVRTHGGGIISTFVICAFTIRRRTFPNNSLLITTPHESMFTEIPAIDGRSNGILVKIEYAARFEHLTLYAEICTTDGIPGPKLSSHVIGTKRKTRTVSLIPGESHIDI